MSTQPLVHKKMVVGLLASTLLVIFGLYIISKANVLADTVAKLPPLDLNTLVPGTDVVKPSTKFVDVKTIIGTVFDLVIGISSGIFVILLLVGGVVYLTGAGNDEQTGKAKKMMIDAVIGLFIVLASWSISTWVINAFTVDSRTGTYQSGSGTGSKKTKAPTPSSDLPPSEGGSNPNDAARQKEINLPTTDDGVCDINERENITEKFDFAKTANELIGMYDGDIACNDYIRNLYEFVNEDTGDYN